MSGFARQTGLEEACRCLVAGHVPLQHVYPQWEAPEDDPAASPEESRQVWRGHMRIVGRQRARKLRRRGVPIMRSVEITVRGLHRHAWFVEGYAVPAGHGARAEQKSKQ